MNWLEQWFFDDVARQRLVARGTNRYPMYAVTALGKPCPMPWSAVLGAMVKHEGWNEQKFRASIDAAFARHHQADYYPPVANS